MILLSTFFTPFSGILFAKLVATMFYGKALTIPCDASLAPTEAVVTPAKITPLRFLFLLKDITKHLKKLKISRLTLKANRHQIPILLNLEYLPLFLN